MKLFPPASIGIVGGGQLGKYLTIEAKKLGYNVTILDPAYPSPAGEVADHQIVASFSDTEAYRHLADSCKIITYEFEHIDTGILKDLELSGYRICPSVDCLININDKYRQKKLLRDAGIPVPAFFSTEEISYSEGVRQLGIPIVFKSRRGGYDGKGMQLAFSEGEAYDTWNTLAGTDALAEEFISFEKEVSIIVARDQEGNLAFYPLAENIHEQGILRLSRVPAQVDHSVSQRAREIATSVVAALDSPGVFCIEMFLTRDGGLYVNEIAPRPHNSGHYTLDACSTSQYEQLIRVLTGMPLGTTDLLSPCVMVNLLGNASVQGTYKLEGLDEVLRIPNAHFYWYGKTKTAYRRKLGHVTILDTSIEEAEQKAEKVLQKL
ncbi:MAG: 5-(carboxyamino)imidazole ribonucleotide synthase, partial [Spirochaetales bacterium]|nr:5-(carboxyamino)imidazole ribonucleotide synthase [Spirochaetales bacterium]